MRGTAFSLNIIEWTSQGAFDSAGLAPVRYADRRRAREALRRQLPARQADASPSRARPPSYPLVPGAQDRVSWMLQLPAIMAAAPAVACRESASVHLQVTGARGDADVWTFAVEAREALVLPAGRSRRCTCGASPAGPTTRVSRSGSTLRATTCRCACASARSRPAMATSSCWNR
jgi:hypothetical protein